MTADDLVMWYREPAMAWVEALPVGNGRLGAMVFGGAPLERIQLNEDTLWAGGPRDWDNPAAQAVLPEVRRAAFAGRYEEADRLAKGLQGPFTQSYLPMGDLWLEFEPAHGEPTGYRRQLDLDAAVAAVDYAVDGVRYQRTVFASAPDQAVVVRLSASQPGALSLAVRLTSPLRAAVEHAGPGHLVLRGRAPRHADPSYLASEQPILYAEDETGEGMRFQIHLRVLAEGGEVRADGDRLRVAAADAVTLCLTAATSFDGFDRSPGLHGRDPGPAAAAALAAAVAKPYAELHAAHATDHRSLFRRVSLDLGRTPAADLPTDERIRRCQAQPDPALAALLFQFGRYLMIAGSRPGTQPTNLQGIWNELRRPPWSANYTVNINTQMNYWPAESANLAECHTPLFDFIEDLAVNGRRTAAANYGCRGWVAHHNADLWRQSAPVGNFGGGDPVWACWPMAGPWLCQHLWEHYAFGGSAAFLGAVAYPIMKSAAEFCLDWLVEDEFGHLVTAPSTSPENKFTTPDGQQAAVSVASTMDMSLLWDLFTNCAEASRILGVDEELRQEWETARSRLRPLRSGRLGQLQEWASDWDSPDDRHRHTSHLFGLHPGRQITRRGTPDLFAAARRSLELRGDGGTGWSMAWKICFWARLGDGDHAHRMLQNMLILSTEAGVAMDGGGVYANLFCAHPPFQIDGNFGATAGMVEMLLQSHDGEIHLLPALPSAWPAGRVAGLRARGGYHVDIAWQDGQLATASIHAFSGGRPIVRYGERALQVDIAAGETLHLAADAFG